MNDELREELKKVFQSRDTNALKLTCDFTKDVVSVDTAPCMYDYADIILRGAKNGNSRTRE